MFVDTGPFWVPGCWLSAGLACFAMAKGIGWAARGDQLFAWIFFWRFLFRLCAAF